MCCTTIRLEDTEAFPRNKDRKKERKKEKEIKKKEGNK